MPTGVNARCVGAPRQRTSGGLVILRYNLGTAMLTPNYDMRIPDFFIIGAPKCGTSALSEYLREHPRICFSRTKEPHFFSADFPNHRLDKNLEDYWRRNFSHFERQTHMAVGEGSATYYLSEVAVPRILGLNRAARFIYLVRNPVDMAYSFYSELCFDNDEEVGSFEEAWELQGARGRGERLPKHCREPRLLQYRWVASLGSRLTWLKSVVPEGQLLVVLFDDLVLDTRRIYEQVLTFLEIPPDGRETFPVVNANRVQRSRLLGLAISLVPRWTHNVVRETKHSLGLTHVSLNVLAKMNAVPAKRLPLPENRRRSLVAEFEPEIRLLEAGLGRDLANWRA